MYFPDDPLLALDPIFHAIPADGGPPAHGRRYDHDVTSEEWALGYRWDIVLRGPNATPMELGDDARRTTSADRWRHLPIRRRPARSGAISPIRSTSFLGETARERIRIEGRVLDGAATVPRRDRRDLAGERHGKYNHPPTR